MNKLFPVLHYFKYFLKARNEHWLHSPFAYTFYTTVVKDKKQYPEYSEVETLRKDLKRDDRKIRITDFGAGSGINNASLRKISSICKNSEKSPALAQLIFRIVKSLQPSVILDLGTSLGVTTLYESKAAPSAKIYTFEGCPATAEVAEKNFETLSAKNVEIVEGNLDITLSETLKKVATIDFAFFDANHRYSPTINYFQQCVEKTNENSVFIFDDIYWSAEMKKAWEEVKNHSSVGMTIDLFFIGIVFFRKKQPVQHFTLK